MKRIIVLRILFTALVVFALSGCGAKDVKESVGSVEESITEENIAEESIAEATEDKDTGTDDIYQAFIDGEVKVKYEKATNINTGDVLGDYLEEGKEYTIDEIVKNAEENSYGIERTLDGEPEYSYIDCGEDGEKELLVKLNFGASSSLSMILKDVDNALKICYSGESWDRSELSISDSGVISSSGSGGATVHGYDQAFVNADGDYVFFYSCTDEGDPYDLYAYDESGSLVTIDFSDLETEKFMVTYYHTEDEDGNSNYYYTYNMLDDDWNVVTTDEDYADTNPYMQKFKEAGIKIYSKVEIDDILTERAEKIKYPDGGRGVTSYFR